MYHHQDSGWLEVLFSSCFCFAVAFAYSNNNSKLFKGYIHIITYNMNMSMNMNTSNLLNVYPRYMHLMVYVNPNNVELYNRYYEAVYNHNSRLINSIHNVDAGFDLYVPATQEIFGGQPNRINFDIKCSAKIYENGFQPYNSGYYLHPRSSISNGPLRLANSTGIIDSGYRGNIIGAFDCLTNSYYANHYDRIVQICAPGLIPIYVELVDSENYLGGETMRGGGGFGSTGA